MSDGIWEQKWEDQVWMGRRRGVDKGGKSHLELGIIAHTVSPQTTQMEYEVLFFLVFIGSHRGSEEGQRWTGLCGEMNGNQNGEQLGAQDVHYGESADADALQTYSLGCSWSHCCTASHTTSTKCRASGWRRLHESLPHL